MIFVEGFFYINFAGLCSMIFFVLSFARKWNERIFHIICVRQEKIFRAIRFLAADAARSTADGDFSPRMLDAACSL